MMSISPPERCAEYEYLRCLMKKAFPDKQEDQLLVAATEAISKKMGSGLHLEFPPTVITLSTVPCLPHHQDPAHTVDTVGWTALVCLTKACQFSKFLLHWKTSLLGVVA